MPTISDDDINALIPDQNSDIVDSIKMPAYTEQDRKFDGSLAAALERVAIEESCKVAEARRQPPSVEALAEEYDSQMEQEWEASGTIFTTFEGALDLAKEEKAAGGITLPVIDWNEGSASNVTFTTTTNIKDSDDYHFVGYNVLADQAPLASDSCTITTTSGTFIDDDDDDEADYITVNEFKNFIYDMVKTKGGALPDIEDWKLIKNMMDMMYDDEEDYEDEWYGSNESEILVGDPDGALKLYYNGQAKVETTEGGIKLKNSVTGDIYHSSVDNMTLVYDGTKWQPIQ